VTNKLHHDHYRRWAKATGFPEENIINNGTTSNDERLGAVRDIENVISQQEIRTSLLVIGGDTIFTADFNLDSLLSSYNESKWNNFVLSYHVQDTRKYGIAELDRNNIIINFKEKPDPSQTESRSAVPCFYIFRPETLKLIKHYVQEAKSLQEVDAPGTFVAWLYSRSSIYASPVRRRFDIGSLDTYIEADNYYYGKDGEKIKDEQLTKKNPDTRQHHQQHTAPTSSSHAFPVIVMLMVLVGIFYKISR